MSGNVAPPTYLVIGLSAAGIGCLNTLRSLGPEAHIIGISDQEALPYNKCFLVDYALGTKTLQAITLMTPERAQQKKIILMLGKRVQEILPQEHCIVFDDGSRLGYTKLFLGIGTEPMVPAIPGLQGAGVYTFHTQKDVHGMLAAIKEHKPKHAVIIGAGLTGLECADTLAAFGIGVSVVDRQPTVLAQHLTQEASEVVVRAMESHNTIFYGNSTVVAIEREHGKVCGVLLSSGLVLPADLVIVATGARPATTLACQAGIAIGHGGILTQSSMATSVQDIYAGGDCAVVTHQLTGEPLLSTLWPDAMQQGAVAAHSMAGRAQEYPGALPYLSSAFFGLKLASCGVVVTPGSGAQSLVQVTPITHGTFTVATGRLKGYCLVGDIQRAQELKRLVLSQVPIEQNSLFSGAF